ncbi:phosphoribosyltransferase family protein [Limibacter armeniacum]|uniref:ComF family protein n=1 Tax=Limibacter armeniacum TaxID=466084 RepID=UPI002FE546B5
MMFIKKYFQDLLFLLFPESCHGCGEVLGNNEALVCTKCRLTIPETDLHTTPNDNELVRKFWGKVPVRYGFAYCYFNKGGCVQQLLHALKYEGAESLSSMFGYWYGSQLRQEFEGQFDLVVPVPIHPVKRRRRGYNQCDGFALGLSEILEVNCDVNLLKKVSHTESQTKKSRMARFENMEDAFSVDSAVELRGLRVLLVDDVVTTGATLEACIKVLVSKGCKEVSIATIALPR